MKNKALFIVWAIVVVIIIGLLTYLGFLLKEKNENYKKLEKKLVLASEKYVEDNKLQINGEDVKIVLTEELTESKKLKDLEYDGDVCRGYVEISLEEVYQYKAYISCENYETKGFNKSFVK